MGIEQYKITQFQKLIANLPDIPNLDPQELKMYFDSSPEELRQSLNNLIDTLKSIDGAKEIGININGIQYNNVADVLSYLKTLIDNHKTSNDHNSLYYLKSEIDSLISNIILGEYPNAVLRQDLDAHANSKTNVHGAGNGKYIALTSYPDGTIDNADTVDGKHFTDIQNDSQAKVNIHALSKNTHVPEGKYIAYTSRNDQKPSWNDLEDKPSNFTPSAHTHTTSDITDLQSSIKSRILYTGDETEMSIYGTTSTSIKTLTMVKCSTAALSPTKIFVVATLKVTGGTGYLEIYVDGVLKQTLSTTSTSYVLVYSPSAIDVSSWANNSIHTIDIKLKNSSGYITYNQLLEIYIE